jgi:hypothetical protein
MGSQSRVTDLGRNPPWTAAGIRSGGDLGRQGYPSGGSGQSRVLEESVWVGPARVSGRGKFQVNRGVGSDRERMRERHS